MSVYLKAVNVSIQWYLVKCIIFNNSVSDLNILNLTTLMLKIALFLYVIYL